MFVLGGGQLLPPPMSQVGPVTAVFRFAFTFCALTSATGEDKIAILADFMVCQHNIRLCSPGPRH